MRKGELLAEHIDQMLQLSRPLIYEDGIEASQL